MSKDFWLLILSVLLVNAVPFGVSLISGVILSNVFGANEGLVFLTLLGSALISVALFPVFGYLAGSIGPKKTLLLGPIANFVAFLILAFSPTWTSVSLAIFITSLSLALNISSLIAYIETITSTEVSGKTYSIALFAFALSQSGGLLPLLFVEYYGFVFSSRIISLVAAFSSLVGLFLRVPLQATKPGTSFSSVKEAYINLGLISMNTKVKKSLTFFSLFVLLVGNVFGYLLWKLELSGGTLAQLLWIPSLISAALIGFLGFSIWPQPKIGPLLEGREERFIIPTGLETMSMLGIVGAVLYLYGAILAFTFASLPGIEILSSLLALSGTLWLVIGFALIAVSWGLWNAKLWARRAVLLNAILGFIGAVLSFGAGGEQNMPTFIGLISSIAILWYVQKPQIKSLFETGQAFHSSFDSLKSKINILYLFLLISGLLCLASSATLILFILEASDTLKLYFWVIAFSYAVLGGAMILCIPMIHMSYLKAWDVAFVSSAASLGFFAVGGLFVFLAGFVTGSAGWFGFLASLTSVIPLYLLLTRKKT